MGESSREGVGVVQGGVVEGGGGRVGLGDGGILYISYSKTRLSIQQWKLPEIYS